MRKKVTETALFDVAELLKLFGDSTRVKILYCLYSKEKSVSEITKELDMSQSTISHQLKLLKDNKLVKNRRNGKNIYYSLDDIHVYNIIEQGIEHVEKCKMSH